MTRDESLSGYYLSRREDINLSNVNTVFGLNYYLEVEIIESDVYLNFLFRVIFQELSQTTIRANFKYNLSINR